MALMRPGSDGDAASHPVSVEHVFSRWLVLEIVSASATIEDYQNFFVIVQEAQRLSLAPDQVKARVRGTPFADLVELLPRDRAGLYDFLSLLVAIITLVVSLRSSSEPTITPDQVEQIIERVMDHNQHDLPPIGTSSTANSSSSTIFLQVRNPAHT
jgi:hypothetical protein